jgi:hypothetical protein
MLKKGRLTRRQPVLPPLHKTGTGGTEAGYIITGKKENRPAGKNKTTLLMLLFIHTYKIA